MAWLHDRDLLGKSDEDDHAKDLQTIRVGLYELGRLSGLTDPELEARGILDEGVRAERAELEDVARSSRPRFIRRIGSLWR